MIDDKLTVSVTYDQAKGYVGTSSELPSNAQPVIALSLSSLRKRVEAMLMPDRPIIILNLDRAARRERDQRRKGGQAAGVWPR
jgi:hypothetical protein